VWAGISISINCLRGLTAVGWDVACVMSGVDRVVIYVDSYQADGINGDKKKLDATKEGERGINRQPALVESRRPRRGEESGGDDASRGLR